MFFLSAGALTVGILLALGGSDGSEMARFPYNDWICCFWPLLREKDTRIQGLTVEKDRRFPHNKIAGESLTTVSGFQCILRSEKSRHFELKRYDTVQTLVCRNVSLFLARV